MPNSLNISELEWLCNVFNDLGFTLQDEIHERDRYSDFMLAILRYSILRRNLLQANMDVWLVT